MKITMYGELIGDQWAWLYDRWEIPYCCPRQVREAIESLGPDEELVLEINSPGGDVWAGFEIYGMLRACSGHTEAHIIAMAASAATTITSACDTVLASPVAQIMIHQPATAVGAYVNNEYARQLMNFLDSIKASIINGYVIKAAGKATRARIEQLVDESTYMPVQDAIELGLVDGILDEDEESAQRIREEGGVLVTNMAVPSNTPTELLRRYEAAVRAGTMQEVPGHPVSREAPQEAQSGAEGGNAEPAGNVPDTDVRNAWRMRARLALSRARCSL